MIKIKNQIIKMLQCIGVTALSFFALSVIFSASAEAASAIRINEIHYDPLGTGGAGNDKEFIELYNGSDSSVNLSGWSTFGVDFIFPAGSVLPAKSYGLIVSTAGLYSGRIFGVYGGKLDGSDVDRGELIQIRNASGGVVTQVNYSFGGAWPTTPENQGPSLSLIRTNANEELAACWAPSSNTGGTPGYGNSIAGGYGAGCSNKAFPASNTSSGGDTAGGTGGGASAAPVTTPAQKEAAKKKKAEEEKKKKEAAKKKKAEEEKQAQEIEQKIAEQDEARKKEQNTKVLASAGIATVGLAGAGGYAWHKKLAHKKKFQEVSNKLSKKLSKKK